LIAPALVLGLANTATTFLDWSKGGRPLPRLTVATTTGGEGGEATVDSMTADATADAALTVINFTNIL